MDDEYFIARFAFGLKILVFMITVLICTALSIMIYKRIQPVVPVVEHPIIVESLFKRGDCFDGLWDKESWELVDSPDGIIERVGHTHYLILFRDQAEKRGNTKIGLSMSIATFDKHHTKVDCPTSWIMHTYSKR